MILDWPVERGAAAVVVGGTERREYRPGTSGDDEFRVASVTKILSAMAALAAVETGRIGLDDVVPEAGATLRHLLAHASGLPQVDSGRRRQPGERRVYSNLGFRVLAEAVADAVGVAFETWLELSVLGPLGMARTRLGHHRGAMPDAAAGATSTLEDLVRLVRCLLDGGAPVLGEELFDEATRVQFPGLPGLLPGVGRFDPNDWGLGFELHDRKRPHWMGERRSPEAFGHFGASGCFVWVDPVPGVAAAAVTDRVFDDGRWAMSTWPAWSDRLPPGDAPPV